MCVSLLSLHYKRNTCGIQVQPSLSKGNNKGLQKWTDSKWNKGITWELSLTDHKSQTEHMGKLRPGIPRLSLSRGFSSMASANRVMLPQKTKLDKNVPVFWHNAGWLHRPGPAQGFQEEGLKATGPLPLSSRADERWGFPEGNQDFTFMINLEAS